MKSNLFLVVALLTVFFVANGSQALIYPYPNHATSLLKLRPITVPNVDCQSNANPKIPPHLLPCYRNPEFYLRENRYPSDLRIFLDLIKAIETSRSGQQKSAREISMVLLYHLRLDGIQQTPTVQQSQDVTPFAPGGTNYYKHRLTLVGLLPKSSQPNNFEFLNESLTQEEMCYLHFMLSYSIDPYKRNNEDCSVIKFEDGGGSRQGYDSPYYGYSYDSYRRIPRKRYRRGTGGEEREMRSVETKIRNLRRSLENMRRKREALKESRRRRRSAVGVGNPQNLDVEVIPVKVLESLSKNNFTGTKTDKGEFTLGHTDFLGPGEDHIMRGGYGRYPEGGLHKRTAMYNGEQTSIFIPGQPLSDCPIENGVVRTKYGSVTIGTVIAGIAAGFYHQKLSLSDFNAHLKGPLGSERIDNIWATTLAGNAADLILSFGLISNFREGVGLRGGWDNLAKPRTYMLQTGKPNYLTDVELRGALDGLWLGLAVDKYKKSLGTYPLSTILEMYYSDEGLDFDTKVRASDRGDQVTSYAPTEEFKKQVHLFAAVMENQRINKVTFTDFTEAVSETVAAINNYIPQLSPKRQTWSLSGANRLKLDPRTNLAIVIDPTWEYDNLEYQIWGLIKEELAATPDQSNLTIICPHDGAIHAIPDSRAFVKNFGRIYDECKRRNQGINYQSMFRVLQSHFYQVLMEERQTRRIIPHSLVALLMLTESQRPPDHDLVKEDKSNLRSNIPGVNVYVATTGPKERFGSLVFEPSTDVFTVRRTNNPMDEEPTDLFDRIRRVPRRLSNPFYNYGDGNSTFVENDAELEDCVRLRRTVIYVIDPAYIYNSKDVKLSLRTRGPIVTVCQARQEVLLPPNMQRGYNSNDPYPEQPFVPDYNGRDEPGDQERCKKGSNVVFDFENLCEDAGSLEECLPLYISVEASIQDKLDINCVNCRYPTSVQYNIQISGLQSSAKSLAVSGFLLFLGYVATSLASKLY